MKNHLNGIIRQKTEIVLKNYFSMLKNKNRDSFARG
jgi:hypothetical protein